MKKKNKIKKEDVTQEAPSYPALEVQEPSSGSLSTQIEIEHSKRLPLL